MDIPAPLVSVIAINHNGAELLEAWASSVANSDYPALELLVVDNASTDRSAATVKALSSVRLLPAGANLGFGGGCNAGAAAACGELLLFMNPDVRLRPDTISALVADLRADPAVAIACATLLEPLVEHVRSAQVEEVAAMAAATMLTTAEHFRAVGGFDDWIFLYAEDTDLCFRTVLAGRKVVKSWNAVAEHDLGGAGGGIAWSAAQIQNTLYVHLKTRSWRAVAGCVGLLTAKTVVRGLRLRDPAVLTGWWVNLRELRTTLAKRRTLRGAATQADRDRLERLGAAHAHWARVAQRRRVRAALTARLGRG